MRDVITTILRDERLLDSLGKLLTKKYGKTYSAKRLRKNLETGKILMADLEILLNKFSLEIVYVKANNKSLCDSETSSK